ncbi:Gx transporter family protein [bacterium]|nr:Gx transporter family protein [bacterium]
MPFLIDKKEKNRLSPELFAICLLLAGSLQIMENLLPRIPVFPWLRLGLAYWILLPFLLRFGLVHTLFLFFSRNLTTLVYGGQVFSSFLISTSAGFLSFVLLSHLVRTAYQKKVLGLLGVSVLLATVFNVCQLVIVNLMLVGHQDFFFQLSPMLLWSVLSGGFIAFLVSRSSATLEGLFTSELEHNMQESSIPLPAFEKKKGFELLLSLVTFILIFAINLTIIQFVLSVVLLLITQFRSLKVLKYAWPFFFYIAWLHLFRTDGFYIYKDWITREGLEAFGFHAVRTVNIIICGQWLGSFVPYLFRAMPFNLHIKGIGYSLPLLPSIFGISISLGRDLFKQFKKREFSNLLDPVIKSLLEEFKRLETPLDQQYTDNKGE